MKLFFNIFSFVSILYTVNPIVAQQLNNELRNTPDHPGYLVTKSSSSIKTDGILDDSLARCNCNKSAF